MNGDAENTDIDGVEEEPDSESSAEVIEFLKLVEQARAEEAESASSEPFEEPPEPPRRPGKYKFGLKKQGSKRQGTVEVIIREVQHAEISPIISTAAILVALFVAYSAAVSMGL